MCITSKVALGFALAGTLMGQSLAQQVSEKPIWVNNPSFNTASACSENFGNKQASQKKAVMYAIEYFSASKKSRIHSHSVLTVSESGTLLEKRITISSSGTFKPVVLEEMCNEEECCVLITVKP